MQEFISMIIPVYNAEKYIVPCLESLLNQTYSHWEAILVNDGSTDGSSRILTEYAQKDPRFQVVQQKNQGVSAARNAGLSLAQGSFVAFIDADDYIKPDYLEVLLKAAIAQNADMVCCNFIEILNGEVVHINTEKVLTPRLITEKKELLYDFIACREAYGTCVWSRLIRRELAQKEAFRPLKFGEDSEYMFRLFLHGPKVYLDLYAGYYYIRNEDSATMLYDEKNVMRCVHELEMAQLLMDAVPADCRDIYPLYRNRYASTLHILASATVLARDKSLYAQYRQTLQTQIAAVLTGDVPVSKKNRLYLTLYNRAPRLYRLLLKLKQRL